MAVVGLPFAEYAESPSFGYAVVLDGAEWYVRFIFRQRLRCWYMDLDDAQRNPVLRGRRLSPGASPDGGVTASGPPGRFLVIGTEPYGRDEIEVWYFEEADLLAIPSGPPIAAEVRLADDIAPAVAGVVVGQSGVGGSGIVLAGGGR